MQWLTSLQGSQLKQVLTSLTCYIPWHVNSSDKTPDKTATNNNGNLVTMPDLASHWLVTWNFDACCQIFHNYTNCTYAVRQVRFITMNLQQSLVFAASRHYWIFGDVAWCNRSYHLTMSGGAGSLICNLPWDNWQIFMHHDFKMC